MQPKEPQSFIFLLIQKLSSNDKDAHSVQELFSECLHILEAHSIYLLPPLNAHQDVVLKYRCF